MQSSVELLKSCFEKERNPVQAGTMSAYMKNHFPFLGIKTPVRRAILKQFFQESGILKEDFQVDFVCKLWQLEEREYQYAALDYITQSSKKLNKGHLPLMEKLIITKSWWDTVDVLAPKPVGCLAERYPEVILETIEGWAYGEHLWLRRAAILFQLKYKEHTDEQLLYRYISQNADSQEFFIRKAIGWALREYSKTNPESVKEFINRQPLSGLSVREGSKYLGK
jgi:3-methyladenine DNA glycosylase AlkD